MLKQIVLALLISPLAHSGNIQYFGNWITMTQVDEFTANKECTANVGISNIDYIDQYLSIMPTGKVLTKSGGYLNHQVVITGDLLSTSVDMAIKVGDNKYNFVNGNTENFDSFVLDMKKANKGTVRFEQKNRQPETRTIKLNGFTKSFENAKSKCKN